MPPRWHDRYDVDPTLWERQSEWEARIEELEDQMDTILKQLDCLDAHVEEQRKVIAAELLRELREETG